MVRIIQSFSFNRVEGILNVIAGFFMVAMMLLVTADVTGRFLFSSPILGTLEFTEFAMVAAFYLALAYTQSKKAQIKIELVLQLLGPRSRSVLECVVYFLSLVVFGLLFWVGWKAAMHSLQANEITIGTVPFPIAPARFILAFGCFFICVRLVIDLVKELGKLWSGDSK